jgi:tetratricopeptide (TPR) repeat protein
MIDPLDPFDFLGSDSFLSNSNDDDKTADELIQEGAILLSTERLLDARTKFLKAIQKDPDAYRAYYSLAGYYMVHVGHFRLALKYIKRAEELFDKKNGKPPFTEEALRMDHAGILYYLSQIRLNLDNYPGALEALDRYSGDGYYADWYPGTRAWVLMKLGNLQEAIRVARLGVFAGAEPGRTLNMLGILLSMTDQKDEALDVFRKAIATEMALGSEGQPATPLNNAGEVYKEMFQDDRAESAFLRATGLPDGCEHVLPALNLAVLYIDQVKFEAAASTIDRFQQCVAQYPLRNDEEHKALVNLARGRIDLHTGNVDRAIRRFETALEGTQWFGKIGTSQNDLVAAATISLAQALDRKNHLLEVRRPESWSEWFSMKTDRSMNSMRSWWLFRRARQVLVEDLKDVEDLTIRHTDSLIEYPTFGEVLRGLSRRSLVRRIAKERQQDLRGPAALYYDAYLAESSLGWWHRKEGLALLDRVIEQARPKGDDLLGLYAGILRLRSLSTASDTYQKLAYRIFYQAPAQLRNFGIRLPITLNLGETDGALRGSLLDGPFIEADPQANACAITASTTSKGSFSVRFACPGHPEMNRSIEKEDADAAVNTISESIFKEEISNGGNN